MLVLIPALVVLDVYRAVVTTQPLLQTVVNAAAPLFIWLLLLIMPAYMMLSRGGGRGVAA